MADQTQEQILFQEKIKAIAALAVLGFGMVFFYAFAEEYLLLRVVVLVASFMAAAAIFLFTERGRSTAKFLQAARVELRKMVWPNKAETLQATLIVLVSVIIVALFLWLIDLSLSRLMRLIIQ